MPNGMINDNTFELSSLRGGLDDTSPYNSLESDACTTAENVEFVLSTLGERRKGCVAIDIPAAFNIGVQNTVTWMYRHIPDNDEEEAELWALAQTLGGGFYSIQKRTSAGWVVVTPSAIDAIDVTTPQAHRMTAQSLHSKTFISFKSVSLADRLHVVDDGLVIRRAGIAASTFALTAADNGVGVFTGTRYYRMRYTVKSGSTTLRRSEPGVVTSITPSGAGAGVLVTLIGASTESPTHWELEASIDNINYYIIATQVIATTTYTDSEPYSTAYSAFTLSEPIGAYTLLPSCKYLSADNDRLVMAGSWEDPDLASRVTWTPAFASPGVGNDERYDLDTDPFVDLDSYEGGEITGMSRNVNGYIYVFKRSHIYRMVRTGQRKAAYEAIPLTKIRGALPGSIVEAVDQAGKPTLYFLDPSVGPTRLGSDGLEWCGRDIQELWKRVNVNALVPCHGVYYSNSKQLHYWIAVDGADYPNMKIIAHVNEMRSSEEGARRGWVTVSKGTRLGDAHCSVMFADNVDDVGARSTNLVPFIGKLAWTIGSAPPIAINDLIQRCNTGGTDAHTTGDTLSSYRAVLTSRPFMPAGLLSQCEIQAGAILMTASEDPEGVVFVKLIKNFGAEEKTTSTEFYTPNGESHVIVKLDDLAVAEVKAFQLSLGDLEESVTPPETWELNTLQLKITGGNTT